MFDPNNPSALSNLISVRSSGKPFDLPATLPRLDLVLDQNGGIQNYAAMGPLKKLFSANKDVITIIQSRHNLVFKLRFDNSRFFVNARLQMSVAPDDPRRLIEKFYNRGHDHISTGLLMAALNTTVVREVERNLSILPLGAWVSLKRGEPVKSADRHNNLARVCEELGFRLYYDQLDIDVTPVTA